MLLCYERRIYCCNLRRNKCSQGLAAGSGNKKFSLQAASIEEEEETMDLVYCLFIGSPSLAPP